MVQNVYISPKHLGIFEERHLFYMLENFFENKAIWGGEFSIRSACDDGRRSEAVRLYHVLC
jgi:hypothetical protein